MTAEDRLVLPQSCFLICFLLLWVKYSIIVCNYRAFPPLYISLTGLNLLWCKCNGSTVKCEFWYCIAVECRFSYWGRELNDQKVKWKDHEMWFLGLKVKALSPFSCCPGPRHGGIMRRMTSPISQSWGSLASLKLSRFQLLCTEQTNVVGFKQKLWSNYDKKKP